MRFQLALIVSLAVLIAGCNESNKEDRMVDLTDPFGTTQLSEALRALPVSFGDNVRIIAAPVTEELGISGLRGEVYGETTPSVTGIEVIGASETDAAINVYIEELQKDFWLSPDLVELIDHAPGSTISIGDKQWVRTEDGAWIESE